MIVILKAFGVLVVHFDSVIVAWFRLKRFYRYIDHQSISFNILKGRSKLFTEFINIGGCRYFDGEGCVFVMDSEVS